MASLRATAKQSGWYTRGLVRKLTTVWGVATLIFLSLVGVTYPYHPQTIWSSPKIDENVVGVKVGHFLKGDEVHLATLSPSRLVVYALQEQSLHKVSSIQSAKGDVWLKLSHLDLDSDGIDELVVSGFRGDRPHSMVASAKGGPLRVLTETSGHLSVLSWKGERALFSQRSLGGDDFTGPFRRMTWDGKKLSEVSVVDLPGGVSGKSLSLFRSDGMQPEVNDEAFLYQSETGPLLLYRRRGGKWKKDWTSGASYGGFSFHLDLEVRNPLNQVEKARFLVPVSKQVVWGPLPVLKKPEPIMDLVSDAVIPAPVSSLPRGTSESRDPDSAKTSDLSGTSPLPDSGTGSPLKTVAQGGDDNKPLPLSVYVVRQEGYLQNVIGAIPSAKNSQIVRLVWSGYGFQEDWNSPRFDGAIADFDLVDWDGDGREKILASLLLRDGGYFDTLKKQDSILILIDVPREK